MLPTVEELDINEGFERITVEDHLRLVPPTNEDDLKDDTKHLHLLYIAVTTGVIDDLLKDVTLGVMSASRWMTTCNRCLLLWISKHDHLLDAEARATLKVISWSFPWSCRRESSN